MFKVKRLLPLLFSLVLLFCSSVSVQAAEISGGDNQTYNQFITPQMRTLTANTASLASDDGIATVADSTSGQVDFTEKTYLYSYSSSITENPSMISVNIGYVTGIPQLYQESLFSVKTTITATAYEDCAKILSVRPWVSYMGEKYYFDLPNWCKFTAQQRSDVMYLGADIYYVPTDLVLLYPTYTGLIKPVTDGSEYKNITLNPSGRTATRNSAIVITVTASAGFVQYSYESDTEISKLQTLADNIYNMREQIKSAISGQTYELYVKMDDMISNFNTRLDNIFNSIEAKGMAILVKMDSQFQTMTTNLTTWFDTLFAKMDEEQDELINGYDPGTGSAAKNEFDSSAAELEAAEGDLFGQTSYDQVDYTQFNSFFSIEAVAASMLFVKSILESLYGALGVFGVPITIGLVLLVFTRIIGFQNFYSGGD